MNIAKIILLLTLAACTIYLSVTIPDILNRQLSTMNHTVNLAEGHVDFQLTMLREDVKLQLNATRKDVLSSVNGNSSKLIKTLDKAVDTTDARVASIQQDSKAILTDIKTDTLSVVEKQLSATNQSLDKLVVSYTRFPDSLQKNFDCETQQLCWPNLVTDTLINTRYAAKDVSKASNTFSTGFGSLIDNSNKITTSLSIGIPEITHNTTSITDNIKRITQPHWYDRIVTYGVSGAVIYRNINPSVLSPTR